MNDGQFIYFTSGPNPKTYLQNPATPKNGGKFAGAGIPLGEFRNMIQSIGWALGDLPNRLIFGGAKIGSPSVVAGVPVDTLITTMIITDTAGMPLPEGYGRTAYSFGRDNHLLYQVKDQFHGVYQGVTTDQTSTETVTRLVVDQAKASDFQFHPGSMKRAPSLAKLAPMYAAETNIFVGNRFPEIHALDLKGKPFSLDQYRGKVLFIHAWTQGVENCETDLPTLEALYKKYRKEGFEVVGIACDGRKSTEAFMKAHNIHTRQLNDGQGVTSGFKNKLNIRRFPFGYLIDREGKVFAKDPWIPTMEPTLKLALARKRS